MTGWCTFNPSSSGIANLKKSGCITDVTYVSAGIYQITLSGAPANYGVLASVTVTTEWGIAQVYPASSQTATGFQLATVAANVDGNPATDFTQVTIFIP